MISVLLMIVLFFFLAFWLFAGWLYWIHIEAYPAQRRWYSPIIVAPVRVILELYSKFQ